MKSSLKFAHPPTAPGQYTTVRRGELELAPALEIQDASGKGVAYAALRKCTVMSFHLVPTRLLAQEHDPQCRTWEGLRDTLRHYYPGFRVTETVTVVDFEIVPEAKP